MHRRLSVIVPLAPHENAWRGLLPQLAALPAGSEVVLVYSGVAPTIARWNASHVALRCLASRIGRAVQMNAGAAAASGDWLWFLHADSRLTPALLPRLQDFLARDENALGYFDLEFTDDGPRLTRLNAFGANLRARLLGLPFGDQGFILPAACLSALGGFDETADYGEDHLLVWRARAARLPLRRIPAQLATSARKYRVHGWFATTALHCWRTVAQALPAAIQMRL